MNRIAVLILGCAVLAALIADEVRPAAAPTPKASTTAASSGMLACPVMRTGTASGRLLLATREAAVARVTFIPAKGKPVERTLRLAPASRTGLAIPPRLKGDVSATVRYAGGPVAAAHTLAVRRGREGPAGRAGAMCAHPAGAEIAATHLSTLRSTSVLSILNPGSGTATVKVVLHADGKPLLFQRLTGVSGLGIDIPPRSRRDFRMGDFAFDARRLTAVVTTTAGRVVAEALVRSAGGVALISATEPARSIVSASARSGAGGLFSVGLVGDDDAGLDARLLSATEQGRAGGLPESLEPSGTARIAIPNRNRGGPVAYGLDLTIGSPVVAATGWERARRGRRETAVTEGTVPARAWLAVAPAAPGGSTRALIVNPSGKTAALTVRGSSASRMTIEPGRVLVVPMTGRGSVLSLDVSASQPVAVFVDVVASAAAGGWTYAYPAMPDRRAEPVAVTADPRVGVPAVMQAEPQ